MAWAQGLLAQQSLIESSDKYYSTQDTDFSLSNVDVLSTRNYAINLCADWIMSAAGEWYVYVQVDGSNFAMVGVATSDGTINEDTITGRVLWQPSSSRDYDLTIRLTESSGSSYVYFYADSATPRQFWVEDVGPR